MLNLHARGLLEHGKPDPCVWVLALKAAEYKLVLYGEELWQLQSIINTVVQAQKMHLKLCAVAI